MEKQHTDAGEPVPQQLLGELRSAVRWRSSILTLLGLCDAATQRLSPRDPCRCGSMVYINQIMYIGSADHGRMRTQVRELRGPKSLRAGGTVIAGHGLDLRPPLAQLA